MNRPLILKALGTILLIEAAAMLPAYVIGIIYGDANDAKALLLSFLVIVLVGMPMRLLPKPLHHNMRAREGMLVVALAWLLLSSFGALPFLFSGMFTSFIDAFFEAVSGFTTTGATVVTVFEGLPHGVMFWRSFTHWIGGMGVLVLTLAIMPQLSGHTSHLVRAESPGPSLSKIVPKMGDTAKILYVIYAALTVVEFLLLMLAGMDGYDAAIHALGTAGTGGFSNYGASIAAFNSPLIEGIITVFMILFGINFAIFYRVLIGDWKDAFKNEELHWYLGILGIWIVAITLIIMPQYGSFLQALRYGSFQVATVASTTGYVTADFNLWPQAAKALLLLLMFLGSCAGSTAGGLKIVRVASLCKLLQRDIRHTFQPRKVDVVSMDGKAVDEAQLHTISSFFCAYVLLVLIGTVLVSLEGKFDLETNFSAALTCMSNVGPGFGSVGAVENFAGYGMLAKCVLSFLMLAGRLEIFPILVLFHPAIWRKN